MTEDEFQRWFTYSPGFLNGALFVRFDGEREAVHILPDGHEKFYGGMLSSIVAQCKTKHWKEITEREAINLEGCHL